MELDAFLGWLEKAPAQQQIKAVRNLVDNHYRAAHSPSGHALLADPEEAEAALMSVLDAPALELRRALAEAIAPLNKAPEALILALAHDCDEVASLICRQSPLLLEAELLALLGGASKAVQVAIAKRQDLSNRVVQRIVDQASEAACVALAGNRSSSVSSRYLLNILARLGPTSALRQALLTSGRVYDPAITASTVDGKTGSTRPSVSAVVTGSGDQVLAEQTTLALLRTCQNDDIADAVSHLIETHKLTTTLMLRALVQSDLAFLVNAYAQLARLPLKRVFALMGTSRALGYSALHQKSSLPPSTKTIFSIGLDVQAEAMLRGWADKPHQDLLICEEMLRRYVATTPDSTDDVLIFLRAMKVELARHNARARLLNGTKRVEQLAAPPFLLAGPKPAIPTEDAETKAPSKKADRQQAWMARELQHALERELCIDETVSVDETVSRAPARAKSNTVPLVGEKTVDQSAQARAHATLARLKNVERVTSVTPPTSKVTSTKETGSPSRTPFSGRGTASSKAAAILSSNALDAMALELEVEIKAKRRADQTNRQSAA